MELLDCVYRISRSIEPSDRILFSNQLLRSALSVPCNIAEGSAHGPGNAYNNYLRISRGSLSELETQLAALRRLGLADDALLANAEAVATEVGRMLTVLYRRSISRTKAGATR